MCALHPRAPCLCFTPSSKHSCTSVHHELLATMAGSPKKSNMAPKTKKTNRNSMRKKDT